MGHRLGDVTTNVKGMMFGSGGKGVVLPSHPRYHPGNQAPMNAHPMDNSSSQLADAPYRAIGIAVVVLWLLCFPVPTTAGTKATRSWKVANGKLFQTAPRTLRLVPDHGDQTTYIFALEVCRAFPHPSLPLAIVVTFDEKEVLESRSQNAAVMPARYQTREIFFFNFESGRRLRVPEALNYNSSSVWSPDGRYALCPKRIGVIEVMHLERLLETGKGPVIPVGFGEDHVGVLDSFSLGWVSETVLTFSGGGGGHPLFYLFDVQTRKLEEFMGGYGEAAFHEPPPAAYTRRLRELKEARRPPANPASDR